MMRAKPNSSGLYLYGWWRLCSFLTIKSGYLRAMSGTSAVSLF
jgi:hypothetical protein